MGDLTLIDGVLFFGILTYALIGVRRGLLRAGVRVIGFIGGALLSLMIVPRIAAKIEAPGLRLFVAALVMILLISLGSRIGARIGLWARGIVRWKPARFVDGVGGGILNTMVAIFLIMLVTFGLNALGVSSISRTVASSPLLQGIQRSTPQGIQQFFATLRAPSFNENLPEISGQILPGNARAGSDSEAKTAGVQAAAQSVVRVSGVAQQCGQSQTGSGFVVAENKVVTNAHVVSGVSELVVEIPGNQAVRGEVVYYDPESDLAVVKTDGLNAAPLRMGNGANTGESMAFVGYPLGGPQTIRSAAVQGMSMVQVGPSNGAEPKYPTRVYSLAGNIQQGNSGGPLLDLNGEVDGVIFAKSTNQARVGYALSEQELRPIVAQAPQLNSAVGTGQCAVS